MAVSVKPPIFVQYTNGGLVAFETLFGAEDQLPKDDFKSIVGIWDAIGQRLEADQGREFSTRLLAIQQASSEGAEELRSVLSDALTRTGDTDIASATLPELVERAFWRFSLLDSATVNSGRFLKWFDAALTFLHLAPR